MTEKIQHIIEEIRLKSNELHLQIGEERNKVESINEKLNQVLTEKESLQETISVLKHKNTQLSNELEEIQVNFDSIKSELDAIKEASINNVSSEKNNNYEIDALVREIEYCINQLKK